MKRPAVSGPLLYGRVRNRFWHLANAFDLLANALVFFAFDFDLIAFLFYRTTLLGRFRFRMYWV